MAAVRVPSLTGKLTLHYNSTQTANVADQLASTMETGVQTGMLVPHQSSDGSPPSLPLHWLTGEWIQNTGGFTVLPDNYGAVVDTASDAVIFGSTDTDQRVLSDANSHLAFVDPSGAGTIAASGGHSFVCVGGAWQVDLGDGGNTVSALGADTIRTTAGFSLIELASDGFVESGGNDTIFTGTGAATVVATNHGRTVVYGGPGSLTYSGAAGNATVFGGSGDEHIQLGNGGNRVIVGSGNATLSSGDGHDVYEFISGQAGGSTIIRGFAGADKIALVGYGSDAAAGAIETQTNVGGSTTLHLADGTSIELPGVSYAISANFCS
jgi:Ca2+-binding RTX toxin-like protein